MYIQNMGTQIEPFQLQRADISFIHLIHYIVQYTKKISKKSIKKNFFLLADSAYGYIIFPGKASNMPLEITWPHVFNVIFRILPDFYLYEIE